MPAQGDPEEWPLWTRRKGFVVVSLALETHVPTAGGVGLCQSYLPRLDELHPRSYTCPIRFEKKLGATFVYHISTRKCI